MARMAAAACSEGMRDDGPEPQGDGEGRDGDPARHYENGHASQMRKGAEGCVELYHHPLLAAEIHPSG